MEEKQIVSEKLTFEEEVFDIAKSMIKNGAMGGGRTWQGGIWKLIDGKLTISSDNADDSFRFSYDIGKTMSKDISAPEGHLFELFVRQAMLTVSEDVRTELAELIRKEYGADANHFILQSLETPMMPGIITTEQLQVSCFNATGSAKNSFSPVFMSEDNGTYFIFPFLSLSECYRVHRKGGGREQLLAFKTRKEAEQVFELMKTHGVAKVWNKLLDTLFDDGFNKSQSVTDLEGKQSHPKLNIWFDEQRNNTGFYKFEESDGIIYVDDLTKTIEKRDK